MSAIELKPFCHEAEVAIAGGGLILRLTIDFGVIDRLENVLGRGMDELIGELFGSASMQTKFLWQMTRKHHSDLSLDQIAGVQFSEDGPAAMATLGALIRNTFNFSDGDEQEGEQSSRPPKRSAGASRGSSRNGSRRASTPANSGRKRRARS